MHALLPDARQARFTPITLSNVERLPQWQGLAPELQEGIRVVGAVLPFRTNGYVVDELIDWDSAPDDPIFRLTFPHREMLDPEHYAAVAELVRTEAPAGVIRTAADAIRLTLNPHPAGQLTHNIPTYLGQPLQGVQHKYRETVLFFPSQGQTCHAYCTFCFRWAQFVGMGDLKFATNEIDTLVGYLLEHPEVTDVLFTGGDPLVMKTGVLRRYVEALLDPRLEHIRTIRFGTKSVAYWPQRFVSDDDADDLLRLFSEVVASGRHLAIMGHYSHPVELSTGVAQTAVERIRSSGANVRMQSPVVRHVNDDPGCWAELWRKGVQLGCVPYYMFVERDTGARHYFELPLERCWEIFRDAYSQVSGMARTVRGPSMSTHPGKVHVLGVTELGRKKVFALQYLQARDPRLVGRPFFARYDAAATWFDQLRPASATDREFFPARPETVSRALPILRMAG